MNDSHLHTDPTSQIDVDYPGTRRDCVICQRATAAASEKKDAAKKAPAKAE